MLRYIELTFDSNAVYMNFHQILCISETTYFQFSNWKFIPTRLVSNNLLNTYSDQNLTFSMYRIRWCSENGEHDPSIIGSNKCVNDDSIHSTEVALWESYTRRTLCCIGFDTNGVVTLSLFTFFLTQLIAIWR